MRLTRVRLLSIYALGHVTSLAVVGCVCWMTMRYANAQAQRAIYANISDDACNRAQTGQRFLGFDSEMIQRIKRVSAVYGIPYQLPAAVMMHENGRFLFEAAVWRIRPEIKMTFQDPADWQIAALCQMLCRRGFDLLSSEGEIDLFIAKVAHAYNPGASVKWARDVRGAYFDILSRASLPERKARRVRAVLPSKGGK